MALANILSRRNVLKGASAALPMLALPAMALPAMVVDSRAISGAVDPHPEWLALWRVARAAVNTGPLDCDEHPLWEEYETLTTRIIETPASTTAGVAAQLMLLAEEQAFGLTDAATDALHRAAAVLSQI